MPDSQAQVKLAAVVLHGRPDKKGKMSKSAAQEILDKMKGRKLNSLPRRAARALLVLLLLPSLARAQSPSSRPPDGSPLVTYETLYYRDGSNNIEYICRAAPIAPTATIFHRTAASSTAPFGGTAANLTSIAVATNVGTVTTSAAHGLRVGQRITVAGGTVDTDLNSLYVIATVPTTTTFTIATSAVSDATYVEATLNVSTTYVRDSQLLWSIQRLFYTTTYLDRTQWARSVEGPTTSFQFACASRSTYF